MANFGLHALASGQAAGWQGHHWDWREEERDIRRMCLDWLEKHPPPKTVKFDRKKPATFKIVGGLDVEKLLIGRVES